MFNATFFIVSQAYVGMATDDEASCWAKSSSVPLWLFFKALLITRSDKLFVTFVKVLLETLWLAAATVLACGVCEYAKHPDFFSSPPFCVRFSTWKREIVWKHFALQAFHSEKPHRAELCKNVWCVAALVEHMPHSVFTELLFVRWPFSPQSCSSSVREHPSVSIMTCMTCLNKKTQGKQKGISTTGHSSDLHRSRKSLC